MYIASSLLVVVRSIHSSQVKEIGVSLMNVSELLFFGLVTSAEIKLTIVSCVLQKVSGEDEKNPMSDFALDSYDRLSDGEIGKLQLKLARLIVVFFELLHLLITRNRQRLLDVMQERKKTETAMPTAISLKSHVRLKSGVSSAMGDVSSTRPKHSRTPGPRSIGSNDMSATYSVQAQTSVGGGGRHDGLCVSLCLSC